MNELRGKKIAIPATDGVERVELEQRAAARVRFRRDTSAGVMSSHPHPPLDQSEPSLLAEHRRSAKVATAMINLVVGVAIWCLVANVARTAVRRGAARTSGRVPGSPA
jgi:hypothetical protein